MNEAKDLLLQQQKPEEEDEEALHGPTAPLPPKSSLSRHKANPGCSNISLQRLYVTGNDGNFRHTPQT